MSLRTHIQQFRRDHQGAALVEFTLLAPVLIGLMCGLAEFGQALRQYHIMEKGVRDAARYLSRVPADPCATSPADANWPVYVGQAKNLAIYGTKSSGTALFSGWTNTGTVSATVDATSCTAANPRGPTAEPLPQITVTAQAPYVDMGMLSFLGLGPITLSVSHQELKVS